MDRCMHTYMYVHLVKLRYQSSDLGCRLVDKGPGQISCTYVLSLDNVHQHFPLRRCPQGIRYQTGRLWQEKGYKDDNICMYTSMMCVYASMSATVLGLLERFT